MTQLSRVFIAVTTLFLVGAVPVAADAEQEMEDDAEHSAQKGVDADEVWPPMPGVALKLGAGLYRSVPCGCVDRGLANAELSGRLHFGQIGAVEADVQHGTMLLGGRFPSQGWSIGGRVSILPQHGRWWDGLSLRAGYRQWQTMGMRARGTNGFYTAINWAVEVVPHLYIESDIIGGRTFVDMPHWNLGVRLGVATRF